MKPHKHMDKLPGRHCTICGKMGGTCVTMSLRALGYEIPKGGLGYAHANCVFRMKKKAKCTRSVATELDSEGASK